ncbi:hypothetical protein DY000_02022465 [Brassica cretica]|uniref:RNase H type-1 domain-containing protein n=1 Tax=Brassica cretica TaxID=69181 RepID=A0ABQ7EB96_BRACR|nr:hypothetical protein DY000_02022465 [Brassica cretica]
MGLGGGNLQGSLSQRTLGYRSKRSEQSLVATTIFMERDYLYVLLEDKQKGMFSGSGAFRSKAMGQHIICISNNLFSWVLWGLWTTRNMLIFDNRAVPARTTVDKATSSARKWLLAQATASPTHSSPLQKALALREKIQEAQRNAYTNVWFRTDSQELARAINSKTYSVELFGVLIDIELLSSYFSFFFVSFISRDHNGVADTLAKSALHSSVSVL